MPGKNARPRNWNPGDPNRGCMVLILMVGASILAVGGSAYAAVSQLI